MRVLTKANSDPVNFQIASAGAGAISKLPKLVPIPLIKAVAGSHGETGDIVPTLRNIPVESIIAAPKEWCPNPSATTCVRVKGNSMNPLIYDGYLLVVDTSQTDRSKLNGKIVIAWNKEKGLTVSRLQSYDHIEVLRSDNREYESVVLNVRNKWKILGKVLWWIGKAT